MGKILHKQQKWFPVALDISLEDANFWISDTWYGAALPCYDNSNIRVCSFELFFKLFTSEPAGFSWILQPLEVSVYRQGFLLLKTVQTREVNAFLPVVLCRSSHFWDNFSSMIRNFLSRKSSQSPGVRSWNSLVILQLRMKIDFLQTFTICFSKCAEDFRFSADFHTQQILF